MVVGDGGDIAYGQCNRHLDIVGRVYERLVLESLIVVVARIYGHRHLREGSVLLVSRRVATSIAFVILNLANKCLADEELQCSIGRYAVYLHLDAFGRSRLNLRDDAGFCLRPLARVCKVVGRACRNNTNAIVYIDCVVLGNVSIAI